MILFSVGDRIAHPLHGAGIIDHIETKKINGLLREYYVLTMPVGSMVVMIPTAACENIGVRPIISADRADELLREMENIEIDMDSNWNKRYRENLVRLKSGDLLEVAKVIKGLMARDCQKKLSAGERKMLHSAKQILISELVMSKRESYELIEKEVDLALA